MADRTRHLGKRVEVTSQAVTPAQMATALEHVLGWPVRPVQVPLESVHAGSADMGAMCDFLNAEGYGVDIPALHVAYPDIAWTTFEDWVRTLPQHFTTS